MPLNYNYASNATNFFPVVAQRTLIELVGAKLSQTKLPPLAATRIDEVVAATLKFKYITVSEI